MGSLQQTKKSYANPIARSSRRLWGQGLGSDGPKAEEARGVIGAEKLRPAGRHRLQRQILLHSLLILAGSRSNCQILQLSAIGHDLVSQVKHFAGSEEPRDGR
jgi:hypothetical protein